mgnify:CR=1 FL=1
MAVLSAGSPTGRGRGSAAPYYNARSGERIEKPAIKSDEKSGAERKNFGRLEQGDYDIMNAHRVAHQLLHLAGAEHLRLGAEPGLVFGVVDLGVPSGHDQNRLPVHQEGQRFRDPAGLA